MRNCLRLVRPVPLDVLAAGRSTARIENLDREKRPCRLFSLEITLFR
jgi:hypothetical protein